MTEDDECIHGMDPPLCSICNGREAAEKRPIRAAPAARAPRAPAAPRAPRAAKAVAATPSKRLTRTVVATQSAETEESVEQYRARYPGERAATFEAYVEVFFNTDARTFPGGFLNFARCASAEPERKATSPALVRRAELLMQDAGYEADDKGVIAGNRRWRRDE